MTSSGNRSLPRFDPGRGGWFTRFFRPLPAVAVTLASLFVAGHVLVYLAIDRQRWDLFKLPAVSAFALGSAVVASFVMFVCRKRPGTPRRLAIPRIWSFTLAIAGLGLAAAAAIVPAEPTPSWLHAGTFALVCATLVQLARLSPLPPLHAMVQWIGLIVLIPGTLVASASAWAVANKLIEIEKNNNVDLHTALKRAADTIQETKAIDFRPRRTNTEDAISGSVDTVERSLTNVKAAIARKDHNLRRIGMLGDDARLAIKQEADRVVSGVAKLAMPPTDFNVSNVRRRPDPASPTQLLALDDTQQRMIAARYRYYREMNAALRELLEADDFRQLSELFGGSASQESAAWKAALDDTTNRLDARADELEKSWHTYWVSRALRYEDRSQTSRDRLNRLLDLELAFSADAPSNGVRIAALDEWVAVTFGQVQTLAATPACSKWRIKPDDRRRLCDGGGFRRPDSFVVGCQLHDGVGGTRPLVGLVLKYEQAQSYDREFRNCEPESKDDVPTVPIYGRIQDRHTPTEVEIEFRVPADLSAEKFSAELMDELQTRAEARGALGIDMRNDYRQLEYRVSPTSPLLQITSTLQGKDVVKLKVVARRTGPNVRMYTGR